MITLALETSTQSGGVALFDGDALLFSETFTADRSHTAELFAVIERALGPALNPNQIIVGLGPGSYAGVRIAIAAAVGLSISTGAQLIGIPSVAALDDGEYLAIGDARRDAYSFAHVRAGEMLSGPLLLSRPELDDALAKAAFPVFSSEHLALPGLELRFPNVETLGRLGIRGKSIHARDSLEPIYLREPHITLPK
jgi:tRNA threonylcarbamoyladenosine biosynthesis protein TsaB